MVGVKRDVAEDVSVNEEDLLGLVTFQSKESIQDECVGAELSGEQRNEVMEVLRKYEEIFTEIPGKVSVIEHKIDLTDNRPIRCKPYPLPYAKRSEISEAKEHDGYRNREGIKFALCFSAGCCQVERWF